MRRFVRPGVLLAVILVAAWRLASELIGRMRLLRDRGELAALVTARRARIIARATERALRGAPALEPVRVHASVHVGAVRAGDRDDVDDVGLLEGAMRRAGRERIDPRGHGRVVRPASPSIGPVRSIERGASRDWSWLEAGSELEPADSSPARGEGRVPAWAVGAALLGAVVTLVPLVRPLGDAAPWLAIAAIALVAAAAIAARRQ